LISFLVLGAFAGIRHAEIQRLDWQDIRFDDGIIEIHASKAKTASRRTVPILDNLRQWLLPLKQDLGLVCPYLNVAFELHRLTKRINESRRAAWALERGITAEELKRAARLARGAVRAARKPGRQKGEMPPGAETAKAEGWTPFAWKHNALRHSFISYRIAGVQNVHQVALEAGNSPQIIFSNYRELVRPADAKKWFCIVSKRPEDIIPLQPDPMIAQRATTGAVF
jgi:integrase